MTHEMSQKELGDLLDLKVVTLSSYEKGTYTIPKKVEERMEYLIDVFGIDWEIETPLTKYVAPYKRKDEPTAEELEKIVEDIKATPIQVIAPASNHYNGGNPNHIDVIKFSEVNFTEEENIGFFRISAIKYIARYGKKNGYNPEDLEKALYYIEKLKEATK